jgi:hypothetical protein
MSTTEPPQTEQELDIDKLRRSPEESGDYDCSVPAEYAEEEETTRAARPTMPIEAACSREFQAVRNSGTRDVSEIRLIVLHCTQSDSARSSAMWFANRASQGSAHLVVDDRECYRTLDNTAIPWGAPGANRIGWHIEHAGFVQWSKQEWRSHEQMLKRGAFKCGAHAKRFNIPIKMLTIAELRSGRRGFVTHAQCTEVFGGSHSDPMPNFPLEHYLQLAREFAEDI